MPFDSLELSGAAGQLDLVRNADRVARALDVPRLTLMHQVHGREVRVVDSSTPPTTPCDALVTNSYQVALCVRVADCVPIILADPDKGVVGVVHAGRAGVVANIIDAAVSTMRGRGAEAIEAWVGPHVCGSCYEVPAKMRADVAAVVPVAYSVTTWGTPALDLGAAVGRQLERSGCQLSDVSRCTLESPDLFSYRRDADQSGRFAGIVVLKEPAT